MDEAAPSTVGQLRSKMRLSRAIGATLGAMTPSRHFERPTADLSSYLESALRRGSRGNGDADAFLFRAVAQRLGERDLLALLRPPGPSSRSMVLSPGLIAVFADAASVRSRTGGQDEYLGGRHVLFSILTVTDRDAVMELGKALEPLPGFRPEVLARDLLVFIREALEPGEDARAWAQICAERGLAWLEAPAEEGPIEQPGLRPDAPPSEQSGETATGPRPGRGPSDAARELLQAAPEPRKYSRLVPGLLNDDPWSLAGGQVVGADGAALALARLATARAFHPPLAVGVFGEWGSGKSFFLRRVCEEVGRLSDSGDDQFHRSVVQIKFNAWHYVDSDLWASLAGYIFEELEAHVSSGDAHAGAAHGLLGRLSTARELTLESARALALRRRGAAQAQAAVRAAEAKLQEERAKFASKISAKVTAGLGALLHGADGARSADRDNARVAQMVRDAYGEPLEQLSARWSDASAAASSLNRSGALWSAIFRQLGATGGLAVIGLATAAAFLIPLGAAMLVEQRGVLSRYLELISPGATALAAFLATSAGLAAKATRKAVIARDAVVATVRRYREGMADRAAAAERAVGDQVEAADAQLSEAEAEALRARESLAEALREQAEATQAFSQETAAGRLRAFVRARAAADGPYRARQGLISAIRRDFADLSGLMNPNEDASETNEHARAEQLHEARVKELLERYGTLLSEHEKATLAAPAAEISEPPFTRIVLYIDDLDRCPPAKVVEVLQAVHLLLAYSLFVVVVAVDVRWLAGALESTYPAFHTDEDAPSAMEIASLDYLEKIFQVPVWTLEIEPEEARTFVRQRLAGEVPVQADALTQGRSQRERDAREGTATGDGASLIALRTRDLIQAARSAASTAVAAGGLTVTRAPDVAPLEPLTLTEVERDWLEALAPVASSSPRRLLRLVNTYRLARASLTAEAADALLDGGGYRPFGALLALAAAAPLEFPRLAAAVRGAESLEHLGEAWRTVAGADHDLLSRIEILLALLVDIQGKPVEALRAYVGLASRFSFSQPTDAS